ncbi:MAG: hypothetical protein EAZ08_12210 [Cytophagales bacterium]|nr:MAG: hypothetical protein EAZ08_12210 [Cytophagales bacterium]
MEIDNLNNVKRFHFSIGVMLFMMALFGLYWREIHEMLGRPTFAMRIGFSATILFAMGIVLLMKPAYFYCQISERKITIKYYKIFWYENGKLIEISKNEFKKYEVASYNYGLTKELSLSVTQQGQIVDYSPISVSLLGKSQIKQLIEGLEKFKKES